MSTKRPIARDVATKLVKYLYRTGKLDWAGGRQAEYEAKHPPKGFDAIFAGANVKYTHVLLQGFEAKSAPAAPVPPAPSATFKLRPIMSSVNFQPVVKTFDVTVSFYPFGPKPVEETKTEERCPLGFWPLVEHNFSIGYEADIISTRDEAIKAEDWDAVAICNDLLDMRRTAREKVGDLVAWHVDCARDLATYAFRTGWQADGPFRIRHNKGVVMLSEVPSSEHLFCAAPAVGESGRGFDSCLDAVLWVEMLA